MGIRCTRAGGGAAERASVLAAALLLAGCGFYSGPLFGGRDPYEPEFSRKDVVAKREPNELVAPDGSICVGDRERYESVEVGEAIWCWWRPGRRVGVRFTSGGTATGDAAGEPKGQP